MWMGQLQARGAQRSAVCHPYPHHACVRDAMRATLCVCVRVRLARKLSRTTTRHVDRYKKLFAPSIALPPHVEQGVQLLSLSLSLSLFPTDSVFRSPSPPSRSPKLLDSPTDTRGHAPPHPPPPGLLVAFLSLFHLFCLARPSSGFHATCSPPRPRTKDAPVSESERASMDGDWHCSPGPQ
jgi:hypothetical protein